MSEPGYWTRRRLTLVGGGCAAMAAGYGLVPWIDDFATNAASVLTPLLIVGGILAVLAGFLISGGSGQP